MQLFSVFKEQNKYVKGTITAVTIGVSLCLWRYFQVKISRKLNGLPPGPVGLPLIGSALDMKDCCKFFVNLSNKYGPICSFNLGFTTIVLLNDPVVIHQIFNIEKQTDRPMVPIPKDYIPWTFHSGDKMIKRRRIILSQFVTLINTQFADKIVKKTYNKFIFNKLDNICDDKIPFKPLNYTQNIAFNTIFCAIFGDEYINFNSEIFYRYKKLSNKFIESLMPVFAAKLMYGDFFVKMTNLHKKFGTSLEKIYHVTSDFYHSAIKNPNNSGCFSSYMHKYSLNNKNEINKNQIINDIAQLISGGTDTASNILCIALLYLAKYSDIQNEIYNELKTVFINNNKDINTFDVKVTFHETPKLRAYICEILRLYPGASILAFRKLNKDININNYKLKKGQHIGFSPYAQHREKKYWNISGININDIDLNKVNMKLWIDQNNGKFLHIKKRNPLLFNPFGTGARDCPGQSIALKLLLLSSAIFIMKYEIFSKNSDTFYVNVTKTGVFQVLDHSPIWLKKR